jgi:hypothetical protein
MVIAAMARAPSGFRTEEVAGIALETDADIG